VKRRSRHHRNYRRYSSANPSSGSGLASIGTDTWILVGLGSVLLGTIAYAIYEIVQAKDVLADTNDRISDASDAANSVSGQIGNAATAAQNVSDQVAAANATVQGVQQSPSVSAANSIAQWWNSL
jgi:hypothetical protein